MDENKNDALAIKESASITGFENRILIVNKLLAQPNELLAHEYFLKAIKCSKNGNYQGSLENYTKAIELMPTMIEAYNNRGQLKFERFKDFAGAISDLKKAVEIRYYYIRPYFNMGMIYREIRDFENSVKVFNQAIAYTAFPLTIGKTSISVYDRMTYDAGLTADIFIQLGITKAGQNNNEGAVESYSKAITYDPNHYRAYYNRAISKGKLNLYTEALSDYSKAIELNPSYALAFCNRGCLKNNKLNDHNGAVEDLKKTIELDPTDTIALNGLGVVNYNLGKINEACEYWKVAISLGNKDFEDLMKQNLPQL